MIKFDAVDFSERRSEEVMFLLTLSVYCGPIFSVSDFWFVAFLFLTGGRR